MFKLRGGRFTMSSPVVKKVEEVSQLQEVVLPAVDEDIVVEKKVEEAKEPEEILFEKKEIVEEPSRVELPSIVSDAESDS